jgi:hypothetical protein
MLDNTAMLRMVAGMRTLASIVQGYAIMSA